MIAGKSILLVEDSQDNRLLVTRMLKTAGAHVEIAENGRAAIERATSGEKFDLILMDIQMPEVDGYEAARTLRSFGLKIPIVALSAHVMSDEREVALNCGFDDYFTKPITRSQLVTGLATHLVGHMACTQKVSS